MAAGAERTVHRNPRFPEGRGLSWTVLRGHVSSSPGSWWASNCDKGRVVPECQWVSVVGGPTRQHREMSVSPFGAMDCPVQGLEHHQGPTSGRCGPQQGPGHFFQRVGFPVRKPGWLHSRLFHRPPCKGPSAASWFLSCLLEPHERTSQVLGGSPQ